VHIEELHNLYSSPSIISTVKSKNEMGRTCSTNGGEADCIRSFLGKSWEKRPLGRARRRWMSNITIDLRDGVAWTGLIWLGTETGGRLL
jgi:hypothetical protein